MDNSDHNRLFLHRLEISFIISLALLILLFYFYPRFADLIKTNAIDFIPDFVIIATPKTIQKSERPAAKPVHPRIPIEAEDLEMTPEVDGASDANAESADSVLAFYYPKLKYQYLFKLYADNSLKDWKSKDSLSQYRDYLAKRFEKMDISGISLFPSTAVERELNKSMGRLPVVGITVPVDIGGLFGGKSNHAYPNRILKKIGVENIIGMHKKFYILESLWTNGPQSISELYAADSIACKNTYASLQQSLDELIINGLVEPTRSKGGKHKFKAVYSPKEMIGMVVTFCYHTPDVQASDSEILTGVLKQLFDFY